MPYSKSILFVRIEMIVLEIIYECTIHIYSVCPSEMHLEANEKLIRHYIKLHAGKLFIRSKLRYVKNVKSFKVTEKYSRGENSIKITKTWICYKLLQTQKLPNIGHSIYVRM